VEAPGDNLVPLNDVFSLATGIIQI